MNQATTRFHDSVTNLGLRTADFVFHAPIAVHAPNSVFNANEDGGDPTLRGLLRRVEFCPTRCLLGLDNRDAGQDASLEAPIVLETTTRGQALALQIRQAFIVGLRCSGRTQKAHGTNLLNHHEVLECVALLRTPVIRLLLLGILRALDGSLRTIMPNRRDVARSCVCLLVSSWVYRCTWKTTPWSLPASLMLPAKVGKYCAISIAVSVGTRLTPPNCRSCVTHRGWRLSGNG
jgi:hypothetical protein